MPSNDGSPDQERYELRHDVDESFGDLATDRSESLQRALDERRPGLGELRKQSPKLFYSGIGVLIIIAVLFLHFALVPLGVTSLVNNQMDTVSSTYADAIKGRQKCAQRAALQLGLKNDGSSARTPITDAITGLYGDPVMMERTQFITDLAKAYPAQVTPNDALVRKVNKDTLQKCFEIFRDREDAINVTVKDLIQNKHDWIVKVYGPKQYPNSRLILKLDNGLPPITGDKALAYLTSDNRSWAYRPTSSINAAYLVP